MGKWAEVACRCPNRVRLPGGDTTFDRPHRTKRRLTAKQKQEVERWEQTRMNMFECGHRDGLVIEFWPGHIVRVGYHIGSAGGALQVFPAVGNPMSYDNPDELLLIEPEDAESWLQEIEQVRQALEGTGNLGWEHVSRLVEGFLEYERWLARHANSEASSVSIAQAKDRIRQALAEAAELCRASIDTGNPIRLLW